MKSFFPWVAYQSRFALRVTVAVQKPDPKPEIPTVGCPSTRCKGRDAGQGRNNTAPYWGRPTELKHATEIDAKKQTPRTDLGLGLWQVKMGLAK